jgi:predicted NACHT family NTPase
MSLADDGYLFDPESEWGHSYNPDLVTFAAIAKSPCLVLLGEPGIGKSYAIEAERKNLLKKIHQEGGQTLLLNLRSYRSDDRLVRDLFNSTDFNSWRNGTHDLHIFLDSLDECLLRIDTIATLLVDELNKYRNEVARLYLRIACRTAVWPKVLEEGLEQLWGKDCVGVYELVPLRRVDVREAANANGLDSDAFLQEINTKKAVPLAIKPITLKFLLNTYRRNGQFSPAQRLHELYLEGCRLLCEEINPSRRASKLIGDFDVEQRLIVAARIAAVTIFANRFAIWTEVDLGDVPDEDVSVKTLCWGSESINGREFQVSEAAVRETLDTGLFSARGLNRMGWAHQTYAEFLAAWYVKQRQMTLPHVMSLIVHPDDPDSRIVPQLHETVAWLSGMVSEVSQKVIKTDPDILLHSDVATADDADKAALVESLLKLYNEEKLLYRPRPWLYTNLRYTNLAAQLQSYICDITKSDDARYVAIEIAEACEVRVLQEHLADVALALEQPYWVRVKAAGGVCRVGDEETKARLKPLALGEAGDDPEDELKGYGLQAVWPNHITAAELFSIFTKPQKNSFGGRYQDFIAKDIGQHLQLADLPVALKWVEKQPPRRELNYPFGQLSDAILLRAWEHLEATEILNAFAQIAFSRLKEYDEIIGYSHKPSFKQLLAKDDKKRRQLIDEIVSILPESEKEPLWLNSFRSPVILHQDFLWILERLQASNCECNQQIWAKLIWQKFKRYDPEQVNAVLTASQNSPVLKAEFASLVDPIELGSPIAEQAIAYYLEDQKWQKLDKPQSLLEPVPRVRILTLLDKLEAEDPGLWWCLCHEMTLQPDSTHYGEVFESDLTTLPGWIEADATIKTRIIACAKTYIYQGDPETQRWLGTNTVYYPALAGYKALRLLRQEEPKLLSTITVDAWKKWAPIILDYPKYDNETDEEIRWELVRIAYQNAPTEFINTLMILIDQENQGNGSISINRAVKECWDERLASAILNKVQDKQLNLKTVGCLLEALLIHKVDKAKTFAESLIPLPPPIDGEQRVRALTAARALMNYAEDAGWSVVWPAIQQDPAFGREVIEAVSYSFIYTGSLEQRLKEKYLADLYIFLVRQYPHDEENEQDDVTGSRDEAIEWRKYIPQRLKERGTPQACEALRRIISELPELKDKLKWMLLEAEALARRQTWVPLQPEKIFQLVTNRQSHTKNIDIPVRTVNYQMTNNLEQSSTHDAFISHASEDKDDIVRPLAQALQQRGYDIWYDEFSLTLGDSLRRSIDRGLAGSKFGIVVLSPNFLTKEWPQRELDGLVAREIDGQKVILPIWHKISRGEILRYSPVLADKLAANTDKGIDYIVSQIVQVLGSPVCYYTGDSKYLPSEAPSPEPRAASIGLSLRQRRQLEQRLETLESEWNLRNEKVNRMREALAIATDTAVKFQLEKQLQDEEVKLNSLANELDKIEAALQ